MTDIRYLRYDITVALTSYEGYSREMTWAMVRDPGWAERLAEYIADRIADRGEHSKPHVLPSGRHLDMDTPHGRLTVEWPMANMLYDGESLDPVCVDPAQDMTPAARLNGDPITIGKAQEILEEMRDS